MDWEQQGDKAVRTYSSAFRASVSPTGQGYGPLYRWELTAGGAPAGHGHANSVSEAQAAADAAVSRLVSAFGGGQ